MLCKKCGHDNPLRRLYCDNCGAELEHDLADVQAEVDREIKREKARATALSIRWFLGVSAIFCLVGVLFRSAYKDLPENDIVAFVAAPSVELATPPTVTTNKFGVDLPNIQPAPPPKATTTEKQFKDKVLDDATQRAAVTVTAKGLKEPAITGLIVTDLILQFTPAGEAATVHVQPCEITALRPLGGGQWELATRSLPKPLRGTFAGAQPTHLHLARRGADGKVTTDAIALSNIVELKALEAKQP